MTQAYKTADFYQRYGKTMAQMGRELGISREAVRKRWLKQQPMIAEKLQRTKSTKQLCFNFGSPPKGSIEYYKELNKRLLIKQRQRLTHYRSVL